MSHVDALLSHILLHDAYLLSDHEQLLIHTFLSLPVESKNLYTRLLQRQVFPIRLDKLNIPKQYIQDLLDSDYSFIVEWQSENLNDWLTLVTRPELLLFAKEFKISIHHKLKRDEIQQLMIKYFDSQSLLTNPKDPKIRILKYVQEHVGTVIDLDSLTKDCFYRFFILYYRTTEWPEQSNFLLNSILTHTEQRTYPSYTIQPIPFVWSTREELIRYQEHLYIEYTIKQQIEQQDYHKAYSQWLPLQKDWIQRQADFPQDHMTQLEWFKVFFPDYVLTRIMNLGVELLFSMALIECRKQKESEPKKRKMLGRMMEGMKYRSVFNELIQHLEALLNHRVYLQAKRGYWIDVLSKIYQFYLKDNRKALSICEQALLEEDLNIKRKGSIKSRLLRIQGTTVKTMNIERLQVSAPCKRVNNQPLFEWNGEYVRVERFVLNYLSDSGWNGIHSEGRIISTIFSLLFWDILFAPVPGVFISPHQLAPMDFGSYFFYIQRQGAIHERLDCIRNQGFEYIIDTHHDLYYPERILCVGLQWDLVSKEELLHIARLLGGIHLANFCEYIAQGNVISGFPDLCLWKEDAIWFLEVKSTDRLSKTQEHWLETLSEWNIKNGEFRVQAFNEIKNH